MRNGFGNSLLRLLHFLLLFPGEKAPLRSCEVIFLLQTVSRIISCSGCRYCLHMLIEATNEDQI